MNRNHIPWNTIRLAVRVLITTEETRPGDVLHVYRNIHGYLAYNPRTDRHFYAPASTLRNSEVCQIMEVVKG